MDAARNPLQLVLLLVLISGIVFEGNVPKDISEFADTFIGKIVIFGTFLFLEESYHWTLGILWILFALLLIAPTSVRTVQEGFNDISLIEGKKWFVERILKENPVAIKDREVNTYPIQD